MEYPIILKCVIGYFLSGCILVYLTWLYYLAVMSLKQARDENKLSHASSVVGQCILYPGLLLDFLCNVFVFSVILMELPKEYLVTSRLSRWSKQHNWRGKIARWFCINLLDGFDPSGCHCK